FRAVWLARKSDRAVARPACRVAREVTACRAPLLRGATATMRLLAQQQTCSFHQAVREPRVPVATALVRRRARSGARRLRFEVLRVRRERSRTRRAGRASWQRRV